MIDRKRKTETLKNMSQSASKTVIPYIHKLIQTNKCSHLIALIYDHILENSNQQFLKKSQAEIVFSLLSLPEQQVPDVVSYSDLCLLLKNAYNEKFGTISNKKNEEISSKSEDSWDEENLVEMEVLSILNSFRNKTHAQSPDIFNFIREENLIRTVMRQAWRLERLKKDLHEMEQKMNYLAAYYVAEKYCACQKGQYSECDSGCHTDRSDSSNNSITKLFAAKRDDTNEFTTNKPNFLTIDHNHRYSSDISWYQKVVKPLDEFEKLSSPDAHIYISKPSTSTSVHDAKLNGFPLSINQIFENMMANEKNTSRIKLNSKKSMNILSTANHKPLNIKLTTNNSLSNETNTISQNNNLSMHMTQSVTGTNVLPNYRNKFSKLQFTTDFGCHDYVDQISCKKIELKKYIEFDTSSFWNKK
ncbi:unnamed protein product [Onchocerca flexuosa]|uniref:MIF4G domain-containing protein n=1 Tax=Onchocerca flexuosa TaxID=387005 RepID=A0A183I2H5_9BILA|nr:unnamed protein product [Onchocerca flexuosa]